MVGPGGRAMHGLVSRAGIWMAGRAGGKVYGDLVVVLAPTVLAVDLLEFIACEGLTN